MPALHRPRPRVLADLTVLALAALAAAPASAEEKRPADLPPGAAAVVYGRTVAREDLHRALARRGKGTERRERLREQFLADLLAERERVKRGVTVTDEEVQAAWDEAVEKVRRLAGAAGVSLEKMLRERGQTPEQFRAESRKFIALQKMARADLGAPADVPLAQLEIWRKDLLARYRTVIDPAALGAGVVAKVGEEAIPEAAFGRWLADVVGREEVLAALYELVFEAAVEDRAAREGVAVRLEDLEEEVARLRAEFRRQPGIEGTGIPFERWLQESAGLTLEGLRTDPAFRARVLARRAFAREVTQEKVRAEWEKNREVYGETARLRRILVRGEDKASPFGVSARPMAAAKDLADRAAAEIAAGKPFEEVAKRASEDVPPHGPRGALYEVTRATPLLPTSVVAAVFAARPGQVVGPLKAVDGWHLVKVEAVNPAPSFEGVAPRVRGDLVAAAVGTFRLALRDDPQVVLAKDL